MGRPKSGLAAPKAFVRKQRNFRAGLQSAAGSHAVQLPRFATGRRAQFYDAPAIDQLFAIVTALTGEISVLYDRLDVLERLLVESGVLSPDAVESYVPDARAATARTDRRDELLRRAFAVLEHYGAGKSARTG